MADNELPLPSLDSLFDLRRVERARQGLSPDLPVAPPPVARVRGRLVRDKGAIERVKSNTPPLIGSPFERATSVLRGRLAQTRKELSLDEPVLRPEAAAVVATQLAAHCWRITVLAGESGPLTFFFGADDLATAAREGVARVAEWMREQRPGSAWHVGEVVLERGVLAG